MKKFNVVAASAVALSAALASGSALAAGTVSTDVVANYNAAAVAASNGIITVPWTGGPPHIVYTVTSGSLEINSRFTVTLPAGFTFQSQLSVTTSSPLTQLTQNGDIGSNQAVFTVTGPGPNPAPLGVGGTITLNTVSIEGPTTALGTPTTTPLQITVQATNNALVTNNDATPIPANAFTSDAGVTAAFFGGGNPTLIDLESTPPGTAFLPADTTTADIGTVTLTSSGSLSAAGLPVVFSTGDTATLSLSGFFNGIASATAGSVTGTISGNTITFTDVPFTANSDTSLSADIHLVAGGTALLQQNPAGFPVPVPAQGGFTAKFAPGPKVTDFLGGQVTNPTDQIVYTNGQVIQVTNFLTGDDAGYTSLLRVNNAGTVAAQLFALVQPYTGGPQFVGPLGTTLAAGTGTVFLETAIENALPGFTLANSGQRATLTIIGTGAGVTNVAASSLLVNPGGVVDNVN
jgi:hypothetical protein